MCLRVCILFKTLQFNSNGIQTMFTIHKERETHLVKIILCEQKMCIALDMSHTLAKGNTQTRTFYYYSFIFSKISHFRFISFCHSFGRKERLCTYAYLKIQLHHPPNVLSLNFRYGIIKLVKQIDRHTLSRSFNRALRAQ